MIGGTRAVTLGYSEGLFGLNPGVLAFLLLPISVELASLGWSAFLSSFLRPLGSISPQRSEAESQISL